MNFQTNKPLVVIVGPTASGKTAVSIDLAIRLNGEIVSADSRLLYRGMDIGTAKPTDAEQENVPHHLIDVAGPDETWSLALYQRTAYQVIDSIMERSKLPILVGGTGQYVRAIIEGWRIPPQAPDESLRESLSRWAEMIGPEGLHQRLATLDPQAAEMIDYRNMRRTIRALEVILNTGERFSDLRKKQQCRYTPFIFGISCPREVLYQRIDQRIDQMIADGLVEEVQTLLQSGYQADLPTLSAIGYGEIIQYLNNQVSLEEAVTLIRRNTRIFVRRQANWFKPDDPRIHWVEAAEGMVDNMEDMIRRWLNGL